MRVTKLDVLAQLDRLANIYERPQLPKTAEGMAQLYLDVLGGVSVEALTQGVTDYIGNVERRDRFPTPAALKGCAERARLRGEEPSEEAQAYHRWLARGWRNEVGELVPCPVCGGVMPKAGKIRIQHDKAVHKAKAIAVIE